jgi:hypothetical protein
MTLMAIGHKERVALIEEQLKRRPAIIREDAAELPGDLDDRLAALEWAVKQPRGSDDTRLLWASILALYAMISGAHTGDYRWHGGRSDFTWDVDGEPQRMDAEEFFAFVTERFDQG